SFSLWSRSGIARTSPHSSHMSFEQSPDSRAAFKSTLISRSPPFGSNRWIFRLVKSGKGKPTAPEDGFGKPAAALYGSKAAPYGSSCGACDEAISSKRVKRLESSAPLLNTAAL